MSIIKPMMEVVCLLAGAGLGIWLINSINESRAKKEVSKTHSCGCGHCHEEKHEEHVCKCGKGDECCGGGCGGNCNCHGKHE